jgi:hypothetical protein
MRRIAREETKVFTPAEWLRIQKEAKKLQKLEDDTSQAIREAEIGRIMMWVLKHRKKLLAFVLGGGTLGAGGWQGLEQIEVAAEGRVLERQADEAQVTAVEANTRTGVETLKVVDGLTKRVEGVETAVESNADLMRTVLEVQLANPATKRAIEHDAALAKKTQAAVKGDTDGTDDDG